MAAAHRPSLGRSLSSDPRAPYSSSTTSPLAPPVSRLAMRRGSAQLLNSQPPLGVPSTSSASSSAGGRDDFLSPWLASSAAAAVAARPASLASPAGSSSHRDSPVSGDRLAGRRRSIQRSAVVDDETAVLSRSSGSHNLAGNAAAGPSTSQRRRAGMVFQQQQGSEEASDSSGAGLAVTSRRHYDDASSSTDAGISTADELEPSDSDSMVGLGLGSEWDRPLSGVEHTFTGPSRRSPSSRRTASARPSFTSSFVAAEQEMEREQGDEEDNVEDMSHSHLMASASAAQGRRSSTSSVPFPSTSSAGSSMSSRERPLPTLPPLNTSARPVRSSTTSSSSQSFMSSIPPSSASGSSMLMPSREPPVDLSASLPPRRGSLGGQAGGLTSSQSMGALEGAGGTFVSVSRFAMEGQVSGLSRSQSSATGRGAKSFLSNLLTRAASRSPSSPTLTAGRFSPSSSPRLGGSAELHHQSPSRSPSAPVGLSALGGHHSPAFASVAREHARSNSLPNSPTLPQSQPQSTPPRPRTQQGMSSNSRLTRSPGMGGHDAVFSRIGESPLEPATARADRSPSMGTSGPRRSESRSRDSPTTTISAGTPFSNSSSRVGGPASSPASSFRGTLGGSGTARSGFPSVREEETASPGMPYFSPSQASLSGSPVPPQSLDSMGLAVAPMTQQLSLNKASLPLCGAILDNKYILIGTTTGLDFLPIPAPGALSSAVESSGRMSALGGARRKKEKATRKPISLIKRTRFKDIAILSERSNILLAIAGRNDHVRVYALDGIRAIIAKKMAELDAREGYAVVKQEHLVKPGTPAITKGKQRAGPPSAINTRVPFTQIQSPAILSPPPAYSDSPHPELRRPNSFYRRNGDLSQPPPSPIRANRSAGTPGAVVRSVPTIPTPNMSRRGSSATLTSPRTLRGSRSREHVASRPGSSAVIQKRKSKADLTDGSTHAGSARNSMYSEGARFSMYSDGARFSTYSEGARFSTYSERGWNLEDAEEANRRFSSFAAAGAAVAGESSVSAGKRPELPVQDAAELEGDSKDWEEVPEGAAVDAEEDEAPRPSSSNLVRDRSSSTASRSESSNGWATDPSVVNKLEPRAATKREARVQNEDLTADLNAFLRESRPMPSHMPSPVVEEEWNGSSALNSSSPPLARPQFLRSLSSQSGRSDEVPREPERLRRRSSSGSDHQPIRPQRTPREPSSPRLQRNERSPTMELADFLRNSGPELPSKRDFKEGGPFGSPESMRKKLVPRSPIVQQGDDDDEAPANGSTLQDILSQGPPSKLTPRSAIAQRFPAGASSEDESTENEPRLRLSEAIEQVAAPAELGQPTQMVTSASMPALNTSPTSRQAKRWTMTNVQSMFRSGSSPLLGPPEVDVAQRSASMDERRPLMRSLDEPRPTPSPAPFQDLSVPRPRHPPAVSQPELKRRQSEMNLRETPLLPPSGTLPADSHPSGSNSPLDYVKLARTKGARLLKAAETKKRTYLAVLCGDEGERIELFTGSRSISLSLNRTFVLPETPRTIEFQLQGDDLVDIYLVYPESIFALEPATVRVREVGVGRAERRARRDREHRMREQVTTETEAAPGTPGVSEGAASFGSTLHPADHTRRDLEAAGTNAFASRSSRSSDESRNTSPVSATEAGETPPAVPPRAPASPSAGQKLSKSSLPYSTFQQLEFIPPVPSSILSSAWTIPPLYTDVIESSSGPSSDSNNPSITVTRTANEHDLPPPHSAHDPRMLPMLSPVSLLNGSTPRAPGPPGLFFVSRGKNLSGIVSSDGRSIIRKPIIWTFDQEADPMADSLKSVEMLIVHDRETVVVGVGSSQVKAVAVLGEAGKPPFSQAVDVTRPSSKSYESREVQLLGKLSVTNQLFFAEKVGSSFTIFCLSSKR